MRFVMAGNYIKSHEQGVTTKKAATTTDCCSRIKKYIYSVCLLNVFARYLHNVFFTCVPCRHDFLVQMQTLAQKVCMQTCNANISHCVPNFSHK